jgi:kumamolisin
MKIIVNRFSALSVAAILILMFLAPATQSASAASVPFSGPVYISCFTADGAPTHLLVFFNLNDQAGLTNYLNNAYYNPSSPSYHNFLSAGQFDSQYSAPGWVFGAVESIFFSNGLRTISSAPMLIEAAGSDTNVENALIQISSTANIQKYIIGAECLSQTIDAPSGVSVPSYKPEYVQGAYVGSSPLSAGNPQSDNDGCTATETTTGGLVWLPCGLQTIYDENPLLNQGSHGQTIALVDAYGDPQISQANNLVYDNIACSDLATFNQQFNLPYSGCSVIYPTGVPLLSANNYQDAEGWTIETGIDMQYSHVTAPQAHILEVTSSTDYDDLFASVEYVVNNQLANEISLSWGSYEDAFYCTNPAYGCAPPNTAALMLGYNEIFQQAAAEGIGVFGGSGDYAAFDPYFSSIPSLAPYGEISASSPPADDPWVTGVGGTTLTATFTDHSVSRLETAWSLGSDSYAPSIGSGGGFSMVFSEPLGQQLVHISTQVNSISEPALGITFYPQGQRGVPDLAADANPSTGVLVIQGGAFSSYEWGGTSLAAPLVAGMTTTIQSSIKSFAIGDLAPSLYQLYSQEQHGFYVSQSQFNIFQLYSGIPGAMFETASGQNGPFTVTPGNWNPVAGLGQLNAYGLSQIISYAGSAQSAPPPFL